MLRTFVTLICSFATLSWAEAASRPNIVYILADDMGYGDPAHAGGKVPTPFLDQMAKEGMRFTDAHTSSSVCTPTRYGIITGRYNWRSKLKQGVLTGVGKPLIPQSRITVAGMLKEAGYHTGIVGKWHLGLGWQMLDEARKAETGPTKGEGWKIDFSKEVEGGPTKLGFDEEFLFSASLDMPPFVYLRNDKPLGIPTVTKTYIRSGPGMADFDASNVLQDFAKEARGFIQKSAQEKKPFFLYLPLTSPHTPIVPSARWKGKSGVGDYGDFLMETDWVVGEVLAELEKDGVSRNTLVIFTSDNGCSPQANIPDLEAKGHKPNGSWRGTKADIFEGGHRVPFLVRWPDVVKAGTASAATICTTDFYATAAEAAGKPSLKDSEGEDSFSMMPLLQGKDGYKRPFTIHHSINGSFAIRRGDWKLCLCPDSGGWSAPKPGTPAAKDLYPVQLYQLKDDPAEMKNVAEQNPELVKELSNLLVKAIREGRTTEGAHQANDGWPNTTSKRTIEMVPGLKKE